MPFNGADNDRIKREMQPVIDDLKSQGLTHNSTEQEIVGLGDVLESTLNKFGVTEDKFKSFFKLAECNCKERKKWLNNVFSWYKNKG